jgi:hypothetical protein
MNLLSSRRGMHWRTMFYLVATAAVVLVLVVIYNSILK